MIRGAAWVATGLLLVWAAATAMPVPVVEGQASRAREKDPATPRSAQAGPPRWQAFSEGLPTYALVATVALDPRNPAVVYAGTYEPPGLWRSDDRGRTWDVDDAGLGGSPVYALAWDAVRRQWWAGGRDGLYARSAPNASWRATALRLRAAYAIEEDGRGRLYAATEDGLFRADDARSWKAVPLATGRERAAVLALDISPDGDVLVAGTAGQGAWISGDGGATWAPAGGSATEAGLALDGAYVSAVLLDARPLGAAYLSTSERAYRSADGGVSWQEMAGLAGRVHDYAIAPGGRVYAAMTGQVARSTDGGRTWEVRGTGLRPDDKVLDVAVSSDDSALVYAAAWDGLYVSADHGESWERRSDGLGYPDAHALAWDGGGNLLAGTRSGLFRTATEKEGWEAVPDLQSRAVLTVAEASDGSTFYAGGAGGLFRSEDGGRTWTVIPSDLSDASIAGLIFEDTAPSHLLAWVAFGRVHESRDGGRSWVARWEGLGNVRPVTAIHRAEDGQLYAGAEDGLFRWDEKRRTWQPCSLPLVAPTVFVVATDTRDAGNVYIGATDGLWRSRDSGRTWHRWGKGLEGVTVTALGISPTNERVAFAGTRHSGLYATTDGGLTWQPTWERRLARASVRDILFDHAGGVVYVASDQGVWRGEIHDVR
jgi:photosystem II stability/assembly factor-like uncharacterized protein